MSPDRWSRIVLIPGNQTLATTMPKKCELLHGRRFFPFSKRWVFLAPTAWAKKQPCCNEALPKLGQSVLEFPGYAHAGGGADEPFNSDIGALLPIALCGRTS